MLAVEFQIFKGNVHSGYYNTILKSTSTPVLKLYPFFAFKR